MQMRFFSVNNLKKLFKDVGGLGRGLGKEFIRKQGSIREYVKTKHSDMKA